AVDPADGAAPGELLEPGRRRRPGRGRLTRRDRRTALPIDLHRPHRLGGHRLHGAAVDELLRGADLGACDLPGQRHGRGPCGLDAVLLRLPRDPDLPHHALDRRTAATAVDRRGRSLRPHRGRIRRPVGRARDRGLCVDDAARHGAGSGDQPVPVLHRLAVPGRPPHRPCLDHGTGLWLPLRRPRALRTGMAAHGYRFVGSAAARADHPARSPAGHRGVRQPGQTRSRPQRPHPRGRAARLTARCPRHSAEPSPRLWAYTGAMSVRPDELVRRPHPRLRPFVGDYVGYDISGVAAGTHLGLPSGTRTFIVSIAARLTQVDPGTGSAASFDVLLAGLHLRPTHIRHSGAMAGIQINFTPFAPRALFGMPAAEFAHRTYDLVEVSRTVAAELHERVNSARTWAARFAAIDEVLLRTAAE